MWNVFVSGFIPEDILEPLRREAVVDLWEGDGPVPGPVLAARLASCQGWLSMLTDRIDAELLAAAPELLVISQMSVGVDNIDVRACVDRGVVIGHTPDVLTETVADTAFALIAAAVRRLPEAERIVRAGEWGPWDPWGFLGGDLHGMSLGIIGMGRIGQAVARRGRGFDMVVRYTSPSDKAVPGTSRVELDDLLHESSVVLVCAPLDSGTRGMIGRRELGQMRNDAILVNIARGPLVDTEALVDALSRGTIGGAALDVTDPEPLPADHALLRFPNCLVVPHIGSASVEARRAMAQLAVDNLIAALRGEPMPAGLPVDGDRSA
ncbi:MAG TPA: D-glycerate dehydrogenase, partial [Acidimicrobiia bacterium]